MIDLFVHPSGQDDNLGDSALRMGLLRALAADGVEFHVHLDGQSEDYLRGLPSVHGERLYTARSEWVKAARTSPRPILVINAGEVNPLPGHRFPPRSLVEEFGPSVARRGAVLAVGLGLKSPAHSAGAVFDPLLRGADVLSWRDHGSQVAAGFGDVAPDWGFALGDRPKNWLARQSRSLLAVTLRFDRPWPDEAWFGAVRSFAARTGTSIVTIAQVARDSPRAVKLADVLGGQYLVSPATRHDILDRHVRSVYARSLAVISDRAHALILGATEGAYPVGTATDPGKIVRILKQAGLDALTGGHDGIALRLARFDAHAAELGGAVESARAVLDDLTGRMRATIASVSATDLRRIAPAVSQYYR